MKWRCLECGKEFDELKRWEEYHGECFGYPAYEDMAGCPYCYSTDVEEIDEFADEAKDDDNAETEDASEVLDQDADGLEPCPFCGGRAGYVQHSVAKIEPLFLVACEECGARTALYMSKENSTIAWNRRAKDEG